jgi:hypothetical protein
MNRIIRHLTSPRLTLCLIVLMMIFLSVGTTNLFMDSTQNYLLSSRIFYSPVFLCVVFLFIVNLAGCAFRQFKVLSRKTGRYGSFILHLGLLFVTLGALYQFAFGFNGVINLPEGGTFDDNQAKYIAVQEGVLSNREYGTFKLYLQKVNIKSQNNGSNAQGLVSLVKDGQIVKKGWVGKGFPMFYRALSVYYNLLGYYVNVKFSDGHQNFNNNILKLGTNKQAASEEYTGIFALPGNKYLLSVKLIPDPGDAGSPGDSGAPRTKSYELKKPAGFFVIADADTKDWQHPLAKGLVYAGQQMVLPGGEKLVIDSIVPWLTFNIKVEPGLYIIYVGLLVLTVGLFLQYFILKR